MNASYATTLTFLVLLLGFILSTCAEKEPPKPTEDGLNTLGCLIDGRPYTPKKIFNFVPPYSKPVAGGFMVIYNGRSKRVGVYVHTNSNDGRDIELYLNDYTVGRHSLAFKTATYPGALEPNDYGSYSVRGDAEYVTSPQHTGWVNLTKADTNTGIVAGTFEFIAAAPDGRTVNITKGQFDVNRRTQ